MLRKEHENTSFDVGDVDIPPVASLPQGAFFIDLYCREFRSVDDLSHTEPFDSEEGRLMTCQTSVKVCLACDRACLASRFELRHSFYCPHCGVKNTSCARCGAKGTSDPQRGVQKTACSVCGAKNPPPAYGDEPY